MSVKADGVEYLVELARTTGLAAATTKDGHVLIFTKKKIEELLAAAEASGKETIVVMVKRPDFEQDKGTSNDGRN